MPYTVFDARGLHLPPFEEGYKVGRGSLMPLVYTTGSVSIPVGGSVRVWGVVPEDEVWRIIKLKVNDAGSGIIPQWQDLKISVKTGAYGTTLPPGEKNAGRFQPNDDYWLEVWRKYGKVTGAGYAWWRTIIGWSYGPDLRWILPKDTYETWLNEDGPGTSIYQPAQNLTLTIWPAGTEFRIDSNVHQEASALTGYGQIVTLVVLRLHEADVRDVNPLTIEGLG